MMKNPLIQEKSILICQSEHGAVYVSHGAAQTVIKQVVLETPGVAEKTLILLHNSWAEKQVHPLFMVTMMTGWKWMFLSRCITASTSPLSVKKFKLIAFNLSKLLGLKRHHQYQVDELVIGEDVKIPNQNKKERVLYKPYTFFMMCIA